MTQRDEEKPQVAQRSTSTSGSASLTLSTPETKENNDFEQRLEKLPEQHREAILRQYDVPTCQATILTMLGFATWVEVFLMIAGTILAIAAGPSRR
jgi:hypothetical protein